MSENKLVEECGGVKRPPCKKSWALESGGFALGREVAF